MPRKTNLENYKSIFELEMKLIAESFNELISMTDDGIISGAELNRNIKAVNWLSRTFTSNVEKYNDLYEESLNAEYSAV
jgi:hypothetical protein